VASVSEQGQRARDQAAGDFGNKERARQGGGNGDLGLAGRAGMVVAAVMMVAAMVVPAGVVVAPAALMAAMVVIVSRAQVVIVVRRSNPLRILT
jgi:hypothetical protein